MVSLRQVFSVTSPCTPCTVTIKYMHIGKFDDMRNMSDAIIAQTTLKKLLEDSSSLRDPRHRDQDVTRAINRLK